MQSASGLSQSPTPLRWTTVAPYLSVIILECTARKPTTSFDGLRREIVRPGRRVSGKTTTVVSKSFLTAESNDSLDQVGTLTDIGVDQLFALVERRG